MIGYTAPQSYEQQKPSTTSTPVTLAARTRPSTTGQSSASGSILKSLLKPKSSVTATGYPDVMETGSRDVIDDDDLFIESVISLPLKSIQSQTKDAPGKILVGILPT